MVCDYVTMEFMSRKNNIIIHNVVDQNLEVSKDMKKADQNYIMCLAQTLV